MKRDIATYLSRCHTCQHVKVEHQRPGGLSKDIDISTWKWEDINMDFVTGLPKVRGGYDSIWFIVDRLTKSAHFIPVKTTYQAEDVTKIYLKEIVKLHSAPSSIILDRGTQFTSHYWKSFQIALGTKVKLSTAFHPRTDGLAERTIQTLKDMLRACVIDY